MRVKGKFKQDVKDLILAIFNYCGLSEFTTAELKQAGIPIDQHIIYAMKGRKAIIKVRKKSSNASVWRLADWVISDV